MFAYSNRLVNPILRLAGWRRHSGLPATYPSISHCPIPSQTSAAGHAGLSPPAPIALGTPRRRRVYASLAVSMLFVLLWAACGGGGGPPAPAPQTGTPAGTYALTIAGTAAGVSRTTSLTLKVN
jgi:hypothetical protein